jgi:hypothetical protein
MSNISELWSTPWHDLQRRLASSLASVVSYPDEARTGSPRHLAPSRPMAAGATWLVRARLLAAAAGRL